MIFRTIDINDSFKYCKDIYKIYKDCPLIFDSQNPINLDNMHDCTCFILGFIMAKDADVWGIFDDNEEYLYGLIIFDNIRFCNKSCAQVHIVNDKAIWGHKIRDIYKEIINSTIFDTLYCEIPSIAVNAIAMCKRLGFKKTGYIPDALPYTNAKGEEKMYDIQIYSWRRN